MEQNSNNDLSNKSPDEKRALARYFYHDLNWSLRKISRTLKFARTSVKLWVDRQDTKRKKYERTKPLKITPEMEQFAVNIAKNKWTGKDGASCRLIANTLNKEFQTQVHYTNVNKMLKKNLSKPIKAKNTFLLNDVQKQKRVKFCEWVIENQLKGEDIFFTDEKRFYLHKPMNSQTNKIRLSKSNSKKLKDGDYHVCKMVSQENPKYDKGIMVAAGMCKSGVTKLIFCVGTMNSSAYRMALEHYRKEMDRLGEYRFQQDGAACHTSQLSMARVVANFPLRVEHWPPNSPDLSPIETLWAHVEYQLQMKHFTTLDEMKHELIKVWNSIPLELVQRILSSFEKRCHWVFNNSGVQYSGELVRKKVFKEENRIVWGPEWNSNHYIELYSISDQTIKILRTKMVRKLKEKSNSIEKNFKRTTLAPYLPNEHSKLNPSRAQELSNKAKLLLEEFRKTDVLPMLHRSLKISTMSTKTFIDECLPFSLKQGRLTSLNPSNVPLYELMRNELSTNYTDYDSDREMISVLGTKDCGKGIKEEEDRSDSEESLFA